MSAVVGEQDQRGVDDIVAPGGGEQLARSLPERLSSATSAPLSSTSFKRRVP